MTEPNHLSEVHFTEYFYLLPQLSNNINLPQLVNLKWVLFIQRSLPLTLTNRQKRQPQLVTSQCSLYSSWKLFMCSSSMPSGKDFPWRSMSGNSGRALDASETGEISTLDIRGEITIYAEGNLYLLQYNILVYMPFFHNITSYHLLFHKSLLNTFILLIDNCQLKSPRNCWYCCTWVLMSTCPEPCCCCCCWPAPAAVPLVIPSTLCTGFNLIIIGVKFMRQHRWSFQSYAKMMNN